MTNMLNGVITSTYLHKGSTNPPPPLTNTLKGGNYINSSSLTTKNPTPPITSMLNGVITPTYLHKRSTSATLSDNNVE